MRVVVVTMVQFKEHSQIVIISNVMNKRNSKEIQQKTNERTSMMIRRRLYHQLCKPYLSHLQRSPLSSPQHFQQRYSSVYLTPTYPSVQIPVPWGLPIEVVLIGQIGHGGGTALVQQVKQRQQKHVTFINELDEPSAKIFNTSLHSQQQQQQSLSEVTPVEDKTAVYTFSVDHSHPFHRHEGHRVFTAVTGSSGCYLRFSTATTDELNRDPSSFFSQLSQVQIPGDCIFTLRFNGKVWHQFAAKEKTSPAFFAISVHTDETGGQLSAELQSKVRANESSIASLTELVPDQVQQLMSKDQKGIFETIPTYQLSLEPGGPSSFRDWYCRVYRSTMGVLRTFASELLSKMRGQRVDILYINYHLQRIFLY